MALRWDFNEDKMGYIHYTDGNTIKLYNGNAFCIMLNEWEEGGKELYTLASFFADKEHAKRCLSLTKDTKGNDPCFPTYIWTQESDDPIYMDKVVLYTKARGSRDLAQLLIKAFDDITIEMKKEEEDED